jgi:two-component system LytT family response regulator/two-component system response regulator LytT
MAISALIIDDEQLAREELKYLLDSVGGVDVVAQGANGIEAVDLIEEHHPDLVFLDVQMPGQDGFAVIQRLMERNREGTAALEKRDLDKPDSEKRDAEKRGATSAASAGKQAAALPHFVFATAYDQYAVRAFDVNAVDYLLKPFDRARVLEAVERVRARLATGASAGLSTPDAESQLERLLRLLNRPQGAEQGRPPAKLIVQAQSRLLLVDQAEICFAAIDEGVIRVVTRAFEGQSKCRTLE